MMESKNTHDQLREYHVLRESAKKMKLHFAYLETITYKKCVFYEYDNNAFEETCTLNISQDDVQTMIKDFDPDSECWKCTHFKLRKEELA